ncbi:hypothetical protein [Maribacter sp.]|uniref:hypothetical protein n=1 Tax=Maribacter sp. TaxID=1897614 RepID=UPI0025BC2579|nr:hypothetical protein [Maribacter sp.]
MKNIQENIESITELVIHKIGNPVSVMVVLATLESFGIRDKDVFEDYGFVSLSDLAKHVFKDLKGRNTDTLKNESELRKAKKKNALVPVSSYLWMKTKLLVQFYPLGIFHLLPIFLQIASIIVFGYSLWAFIGFNIVQSTSVVFGVIIGLIVSGGYVQVLGRQASFYWHHQEFKKAKMVVNKLIKSGIKGLLLTFLSIAAVNFLFNLYPFSFILITCVYAFLIGLLLLVSAPFHTIRQRWVISLAILLATAIALFLKLYTNTNTYVTHWAGIGVAIIVSKLFLEFFFNRKKGFYTAENLRPKKLMVIYKNYRYFFYGTLIYVFIFMDRFLAWSADIDLTHQFIFLYEKDYEIGMDIAILIFFMLAGVLEYAIASFSKFLDIKQRNTLLINKKVFNKSLFRMYLGHISLLILTALVTTTFIYLLITQPWGYEANFGETLDFISIKVCVLGGIGYLLLTWGMLNSLYLFTLDSPKGPLRSIIIACLVNLVVGFILSRTISYEYSVVGMLVGAGLFMILTLREIIIFFKKLDYHYYAAY